MTSPPQASTSRSTSPARSSSSTPASSTRAPTSAVKMDVDSASDEIEILEERNGSPPAGGKRKKSSAAAAADASAEPAAKPKKPKLDTSNASASSSIAAKKEDTPAKKSATAKGKEKETAESSLVELKGNKLKLLQKVVPNKLDAMSFTRVKLAFVEWAVGLLSNDDAKLDEWPVEHNGIIATLIHESTQTLAGLTTSTKKTIVDYIIVGIPADEDDDSQDNEKMKTSIANRITYAPLRDLISSLAERKNYGLEADDLPSGLPEGVEKVPESLQIWCWEVTDVKLLPSEMQSKFSKRQADREAAKPAAVALFTALSESDQSDLLHDKAPPKKSKPASASSGSASTSTPKAKTETKKKPASSKKVKTPEEEAEIAEKARIKAEKEAEKAEKEAEKAEKKAAKEEAAKEKEAKKAERDAKKAEKRDKEEKQKALLAKQKNMLSGFFVKKSTSPAPVEASRSPDKSKPESDFDKVFFPFQIKANVKVAPPNRWAKKKGAVDVKVNSDESLTAKDAIKQFTASVPKHRILPYNPHPAPPVSVRQTVVAINELGLSGGDAREHWALLADRKKVPVKVLQFKEDIRPGYVGTWTKTSKTIGPRTPFGLDTALLNYDVDSEEEWEDDVEGEDVASGGEKSDDDDDEDGADSDAMSDNWLCDDNVVEYEPGFDGEDEIKMDLDGDADLMIVDPNSRQKILDRERKNKEIKASKEKKQVSLLIPLVKGPFFEDKFGDVVYQPFSKMRVQFINDAQFGLDPLRFVSKPFGAPAAIKLDADVKPVIEGGVAGPSTAVEKKPKAPAQPAKPLPSHLVPSYIKAVHRSKLARKSIETQIWTELKQADKKVTQNMVTAAWLSLGVTASREPDGRYWIVPDAVRLENGV